MREIISKRVNTWLVCMGLALAVGSVPGVVKAQECVEDVLCVITDERSDGVDFLIDNLLDEEILVIFEVQSINMTSSVRFPHTGTYPADRRSRAFTLRPKDRDKGWRFSYSFRWRAVANTLGCKDELFCIEVEEHEGYIDAFIRNLQPFDITVELDISVENTNALVDLPHVDTYPGQQRTFAFRLNRMGEVGAIQFKYAYQWMHGSLKARPDVNYAYALPYAPGKAFPVIQGFNGAFSHQNKHAIDWDMPERTPIHAARGGIVVDVVDHYSESGLSEQLKTKANHILIQHDDGTIGNYVHLAPNGAFVSVGQHVRQGHVIGVSGNTGYSSGPHLHFEVFTLTQPLDQQTLPVRFRTAEGGLVELQEGQVYRAQ